LQKRVVASGISSDVFITADVSGNSLLVRAPAKSMELLAAIIKELDSLPAAESQIKVFTGPTVTPRRSPGCSRASSASK
jgi:type II secretory pathway component GspD/PulD (secretin)